MIEVETGTLIPDDIAAAVESSVDAILSNIAEAARSHWLKLAGQGLRTTRRDYMNGIQPVRFPAQHRAVITLVGVLPNLIELGMPETDLHDTLLGPKVPVAPMGERGKHEREDGGFFRAIPFRHATPGTKGAVGRAMGDPYEGHEAVADAGKLGRRVYAQAKQLAPTKTDPYGGGTRTGGRLPEGLAPKLKPHHAVDIYAGMIREEKTYERATQSQYVTFRTISTGSPGWLRPATEGVHYAEQVARFVTRIAPQAFKAYVESLK